MTVARFAGFCQIIGFTTSITAERWGFHDGLKLAWILAFEIWNLETDAQLVVPAT